MLSCRKRCVITVIVVVQLHLLSRLVDESFDEVPENLRLLGAKVAKVRAACMRAQSYLIRVSFQSGRGLMITDGMMMKETSVGLFYARPRKTLDFGVPPPLPSMSQEPIVLVNLRTHKPVATCALGLPSK